MAPQAHRHRPTLKQTNKGFKSKHASKGSLKTASKGKTEAIAGPSNARKSIEAGSKKVRLLQKAQKRDAKQRANRDDARFFSTSSGGGKVPRVVTIVPLLPSISTERFVLELLPSLGLEEDEIVKLSGQIKPHASILVPAPRFKTNVLLNILPSLDLYPTLDCALVSDALVLLMSSTDEVQLEGEAILRCLQGQVGGVNVIPCVQAPLSNPLTPATKSLIHKSLLSFITYFYPEAAKIYSADTAPESLILARHMCEASPAHIRHPEGRSWIVAEGQDAVQWQATGEAEGKPTGELRVTGTVRGGPLSANRLVFIPGHGDFSVSEIIAAPPREGDTRARNGIEVDLAPVSVADENADDLTSHNVPDLLANEQTWPTEEEMATAPAALQDEDGPRKVKRVPKGTSAYQAAWIVDEDDGEDDESDDDDEDDMEGDDVSETESHHHDDQEEMEEIELDEHAVVHEDMDAAEEEAQYAAYLKQRERAAADDVHFPDEIDTPLHIPAQTRFQRYRGLHSFRTSPWDPYENLPLDYGEIFQFESFAATQKRVEAEARADGVQIGTRVTIVIKDVPQAVFTDRAPGSPFIVHGLLRHEHKQTVLHFVVQRNTEFTEPVKAKEEMVLCVGPRRFVIKPLLSQHVRGGGRGVNNVHKSERYLRPGQATVLTTYGPTCFGKAPCLLLKQGATPDAVPDLVAMGSFLSSDPTRIIAKRIILTGHPFKVHKKTATIRYMFFNREDVDYFKTVELHTKYGRTGHIREALGTHGYFKAHFDGPVQQMDSVCMSLYKRQFPKWSEEFKPVYRPRAAKGDEGMDVE